MVLAHTPLCPTCKLGTTQQVAVTTKVTLYWCPQCGTLLGARTTNVAEAVGQPKVPQLSDHLVVPYQDN